MITDKGIEMMAEAIIKRLESDLAAVTAERDALKAQLAAVPVGAIKYYFSYSIAQDSAPLLAYAKAEHAIKDWLEIPRR